MCVRQVPQRAETGRPASTSNSCVCAVCRADYTVSLLHFGTALKSRPLAPTVTMSAGQLGYVILEASGFLRAHSSHQGAVCQDYCSQSKRLTCRNTHTPFQLPKPVSSRVDLRVLIWPTCYLCWRFPNKQLSAEILRNYRWRLQTPLLSSPWTPH